MALVEESLISEDGGIEPGLGEVEAALADIGDGYGVYLKLIGLRLLLLLVVLLFPIPEEGGGGILLFGD